MLSGDFHVYGPYTRPFGFGRHDDRQGHRVRRAVLDGHARRCASKATACGSTASRLTKGDGAITGAAFVGWNGTYSFNADGRRLAVETLDVATMPDLPPLTGLLEFSASGSGTFDEPRYDVKCRRARPVLRRRGRRRGHGPAVGARQCSTYELEAASPRLAVSGTGRIALDEQSDAELSFRDHRHVARSVRARLPADLSPYHHGGRQRHASASSASCTTPTRCGSTSTVEQLDLRLVDYRLRNRGRSRAAVDGRRCRSTPCGWSARTPRSTWRVRSTCPSRRCRCRPTAPPTSPCSRDSCPTCAARAAPRCRRSSAAPPTPPVVSGRRSSTEGRLRHFSFPHALEELNGIVTFNASRRAARRPQRAGSAAGR